MKKIIILLLALLLSGCSYTYINNTSNSLNTGETNSSKPVLNKSDVSSTSDSIKQSVTPYQYLNLFAANSDNFSLLYTVKLHEVDKTESGKIFKNGEMYAETFTTVDDDNKPIMVREIEKDNNDYFIIESNKKIAVYNAPASEMLLNKMLFAAKSKVKKAYTSNDYYIYEYDVKQSKDNTINFNYRFYMKNQQLVRLELCIDDILQKTYEFTPIEQDTAEAAIFELPKGYNTTVFDYTYINANIPPWWDIDGL